MNKILSAPYFKSKNTPTIAQRLLGMVLVRQSFNGRARRYMITEVEAYHGFKDKASHAHRGKTKRNAPLFADAGHWYVYLVYGVYWMLNIVTGPRYYPGAILIRGAVLLARQQRRYDQVSHVLINGPGKLTRILGVDKRFNEKIASKKTGLWIENWGITIPPRAIKRLPRIGVSYAQEYASKPWRFSVDISKIQQN